MTIAPISRLDKRSLRVLRGLYAHTPQSPFRSRFPFRSRRSVLTPTLLTSITRPAALPPRHRAFREFWEA